MALRGPEELPLTGGGYEITQILVAAAPVAALVLCQTISVAQQPTLPSASRSALSDFLSQSVNRGDVPGVVAAVVNRDTVLFEEAAGKLDEAYDVDMPANAIFRIASTTKPITTVAALMLAEEG